MPNIYPCQETQGRYGAVEATQKVQEVAYRLGTIGYQGLEVINYKGDEPAGRVRRQAVQESSGYCSAATTLDPVIPNHLRDTSSHSFEEIEAPSVYSPTRTKQHLRMCTSKDSRSSVCTTSDTESRSRSFDTTTSLHSSLGRYARQVRY